MSDLFYLQDSRSNVGSRAMFWRDGGGYTSNLDEAEQFTRAAAVKQYECRETDLPWPVDYVRALAEVGVDHQYIDDASAQAFDPADDQVYVAYERMWDGNDLYWIQSHGSSSSNLAEAGTWPAAEAEAARVKGYQVWPKRYIDANRRTVVQACKLDHKKALHAVGLKLPKLQRQKVRRETYRCGSGYGGCGRFLRPADYYTSCPHCGMGNAP
ncbi:hypothetical protein HNQ27_17510 [Pseudomonas sp. B11D7D]|nr:hypothetical protein [Pseudomonas sp. B11D7D]QNH04474.1 hypothetical protein HNQ27_17510 [Pseudomonas sp. B11D7D]